MLDCLPAYSKEAEAHLSKALKNDPGLVDAWLTLGHCAWRKDNVAEALSNFQMAESLVCVPAPADVLDPIADAPQSVQQLRVIPPSIGARQLPCTAHTRAHVFFSRFLFF